MINQEQKQTLVKRIESLLDETIKHSIETSTEPLIASPENSEVRESLNLLTSNFWDDFVNICTKNNIDVELEWKRIRKNLSSFYSRGTGYNRKRPKSRTGPKCETKPYNQLNNNSEGNLTVEDFTAV